MTLDRRPFVRLALIGVLAASFALAACGRKGPLDPPPSALATGQQVEPVGEPVDEPITTNREPITTSRGPVGPDGKPIAPGMRDKRIPLDVLLN